MADTFDIEALPEMAGLSKDDVFHVQVGTIGSRVDYYVRWKWLLKTPIIYPGDCLGVTVPASSTRYLLPGTVAQMTSNYNYGDQFVIGQGMLVWAFVVRLDANMGGDKLDIYLRKNDADDYLLLTRTSGQGLGWNYNIVQGQGWELTQTDKWALKVVNSHTGATPGFWGWALYFK